MDPIFCGQVRHLYEVERLSMRQIAKKLGVSKKRVSRIIRNEKMSRPLRESILKPYERLIDQWYQEYPFLKASQVYERLKAYEFKESYCTVSLYTQKYRQKKRQAYHELTFLPGEVAQIDWMEVRLPWGSGLWICHDSGLLPISLCPVLSSSEFGVLSGGSYRGLSRDGRRCPSPLV